MIWGEAGVAARIEEIENTFSIYINFLSLAGGGARFIFIFFRRLPFGKFEFVRGVNAPRARARLPAKEANALCAYWAIECVDHNPSDVPNRKRAPANPQRHAWNRQNVWNLEIYMPAGRFVWIERNIYFFRIFNLIFMKYVWVHWELRVSCILCWQIWCKQ